MASDQVSSSMGVASSLRSCMEFMFKEHYRRQMTALLYKIIADAAHPDISVDHNTTRQANLKKNMVLIRGLANSWDDLTDKCVDGTDPPDVMIKEVLDMMIESQCTIEITDVLCTSTYVADVCTELILNESDDDEIQKHADIHETVDKIVVMYVDYILDKNMMACRDFLFWLDYH